MFSVSAKTTNGGHMDMLGIPLIDVRLLSRARSALPHAPVIEDERARRARSGRSRRTALGSRHG
jgi:hypothetical protein